MSTLKKYKKMENVLFARFAAHLSAAFSSIRASFGRLGIAGQQKMTIMFIPHTEKKILNFQLSFFALAGFCLAVGIVLFAFVFSATRFSDTAGKLRSSAGDLKTTQSDLDAIRDQTSLLVKAAKRFETALSSTMVRIGARPSTPDAAVQRGDLASFFETDESGTGSVREISELKRVTDYLNQAVDPLKDVGSLLKNNGDILTEIPNVWPVKGTSHISMYYGQNENPFTGLWYIHKGIDISTYRSGDPVLATADGKVSYVGFEAGFGNYIIITHSYGFITRYAHLSAFRVQKGQKVQQGQIIGLVGNTGLSTGPHLHYEVHLGTGVIDPLKSLNIRTTAGTLTEQKD